NQAAPPGHRDRRQVRRARHDRRRRHCRTGRRAAARHRSCTRRIQHRAAAAAQEGRLPDARRADQGTQEGRTEGSAQAFPVQQTVMGGSLSGIALKDLLEAGVHFGHQTKRWNPKMKQYIFGERNGIYIIDLGKTAKLFREAEQFASNLAAEGRTILFVGTKRQAQDAIAEEAQRCGMFYVNQRWLGGLLTNFMTIQRSLARLRDLEAMETDGRYDSLSKKEISQL